MEIITGENEIIKNEINEILYVLEHGKIKEKLSVLSSLKALLEVSKYIDNNFLDFDHKILSQSYLLEQYEQSMNINCNKFINNFCENKGFHQDYLKKILYVVGEELKKVNDDFIVDKKTYLETDECFDIIYEYFKLYGYQDLFKEFVSSKRIFEIPNVIKKDSGLITYNTINGKCLMFLESFDKTIKAMLSVVHEFGHIIDFETIKNKCGANDKLKLNTLSIYNESISKLHEKEFLHFLISNNILEVEAKDLLLDYYYLDYDTIFSLYALTFLPDNLLVREKYMQIPKERMFSYFPSELLEVHDYPCELNPDLSDNINYGYGAIVSEFLREKQEITGDFYNYYRAKLFDPNFLIENDLSTLEFEKIYSKKLDKIK